MAHLQSEAVRVLLHAHDDDVDSVNASEQRLSQRLLFVYRRQAVRQQDRNALCTEGVGLENQHPRPPLWHIL